MAEIASFGVNVDQNTRLAQNAQDTADNAADRITNLNDPNLMSVIEKQTAVSQYAGLASQYNVILARAKDASISTTALTTAYTNLNTFMASILTDTTKASDVNRETYKSLTDAYNTALSNVQSGLSDSFNADIDNMQSGVSVASQAASSAVIVASQAAITGDNANQVASRATVAANDAQSAGNNATSVANTATSVANSAKSAADSTYTYANSEIAVQSNATAKAQSKADNAFSQATTAIDNGKVTSQAVTDFKDGSKLTIAELENGLATKVANSEYASYKTQTDNLIAEKVATKDFTAYQDTTAKAISSKVESSDFNTYKTQTANEISSKVESSDFQTLQTQVNDSAVGTNLLTGTSYHTVTGANASGYLSNETNDDFLSLFQGLEGQTVTISVDYEYSGFVAGTNRNRMGWETRIVADSKTLYFGPWYYANSSTNSSGSGRIFSTFVVPKNITSIGYAAGYIQFSGSGTGTLSHLKLEKGTVATDWSLNPEEQATQSQITQLSGEIDLRVTKGGLVDQINIQAGKTLISSSGQLTLSGKSVVLDSVDPVIMKSANIGNLAVGTAQIGDGAITNAKIGKLAVGTAQIANAAITDAQVGNVSANKLTAGTIDFNTITGENVNASNITTGTLSTDRLNVGKLSALSANLGDVTAGTLKGVDIVANTFSTPNGSFTTDASGTITANNMTLNGGTLTSPTINTSTINGSTINTPDLNLGDNGQLTGSYSVNDDISYFQPINGTGSLHIDHGYIQSTANILYYNKILNGIGGNKWGHWASSTQFVPAPDQAHPDTGNVAESTLTPAFLKLDIFNADKSSVNSRAYIDGTGLYINSGGTESVISMLSDYELLSNGMAYLNSGIKMKQHATFTFGNLAMNGYHSIAMLDGKAVHFQDKPGRGAHPIEVEAKTFTKRSQLSIKHDITPLSTTESSRLLNAIDVEKFRYTHDGATYKYQYGGVIDDVNSLGSKQYSMPSELLSEDGTGINLDSLTGILIKTVQEQERKIGKLSMRLTRLEMEK